jgi:hypothetical protein
MIGGQSPRDPLAAVPKKRHLQLAQREKRFSWRAVRIYPNKEINEMTLRLTAGRTVSFL